MTSRLQATSILLLALLGLVSTSSLASTCPSEPDLSHFYSDGWGFGPSNQRYQPHSDIDRANIEQLKLSWVFALDETMNPHSYPLVTKDTVFVGTGAGNVYALDRRSGCTRWVFSGEEYIRTAIIHGLIHINGSDHTALFYGTSNGNVYAISARNGKLLWKADIKVHPMNVVTGTPLFRAGRLYVPVSSMELGLAISPFYECCTSSGALVALDADSGAHLWRERVNPEPARVVGKHWYFVKKWGPSGAPLWSAPAMDDELGLVFAGSGENYTAPASLTSDSILAFDREEGSIRWSRQFTAGDAFNMSCTVSMQHPNCPQDTGPDYDFGAPPILALDSKGEKILLAGQKSASVHAMDPATGELRWQQHLGRGGYLGGVHWGMAVNQALGLLYVPINDLAAGPAVGAPAPGLHALDISTGEVRWAATRNGNCEGREKCRDGFSAAATATAELVFVSVLDGMTYAIDAVTGEFLWQFDSWRDFDSVNELPTQGGAIDVHGPMVAGNQLMIQSGYGSFGQRGGNALLVFELDGDNAGTRETNGE